tara:strand:+ start:277 stop:435 length:159 start_codon:yes stop_codon:yes gene_type:complete
MLKVKTMKKRKILTRWTSVSKGSKYVGLNTVLKTRKIKNELNIRKKIEILIK